MGPLDVQCPECKTRPGWCCEPLEEMIHVGRVEFGEHVEYVCGFCKEDIRGRYTVCDDCIAFQYWVDTLAANLAIGGALCKAYGLGYRFATWEDYHNEPDDDGDPRNWHPGCRRSAP